MDMRIAFDLDDTLIPCRHPFPVERRPWLARLLGTEPLRLGAVALLQELRSWGCELWIYTTSCRSPWSIWIHFLSYGVRLRGVVNYDRHMQGFRGGFPDPRSCSKYPPGFGLDLLIDDSEGVKEEGDRYCFRVLRVNPKEKEWAALVRQSVKGWQS